MKISFFYGNLQRGGAQRVISVLANQFTKQGDEVTILTLDSGNSEYKLLPEVLVIGLNVAGNSSNKLDAVKRRLSIINRLKKYQEEEKPDVVVCFSTELYYKLHLASLGKKSSCKLICSERANPAAKKPSALDKIQLRAVEKADGFIFQTQRVSELFSRTLRDKGTVIHNGLFSEEIPETVVPFEQRDSKKICAVGRMDDQKAYDTMFSAFAVFSEQHPEYILNVYGDGQNRSKLEQLIKELDLESRIVLHGNRPDAVEQIKDAGMFVMTSRYEGMPNALIEAMACGLPCVCTDCDFGPAELIDNGESGLLVPVDDVQAIAAAMAQIADNQALAEKLSNGALEIRRTHSRDAICKQYRDYIESIVRA
jgi:glycosyltransferase involved in cell wall biosynthesis